LLILLSKDPNIFFAYIIVCVYFTILSLHIHFDNPESTKIDKFETFSFPINTTKKNLIFYKKEILKIARLKKNLKNSYSSFDFPFISIFCPVITT
jgi:hypothetical protein